MRLGVAITVVCALALAHAPSAGAVGSTVTLREEVRALRDTTAAQWAYSLRT